GGADRRGQQRAAQPAHRGRLPPRPRAAAGPGLPAQPRRDRHHGRQHPARPARPRRRGDAQPPGAAHPPRRRLRGGPGVRRGPAAGADLMAGAGRARPPLRPRLHPAGGGPRGASRGLPAAGGRALPRLRLGEPGPRRGPGHRQRPRRARRRPLPGPLRRHRPLAQARLGPGRAPRPAAGRTVGARLRPGRRRGVRVTGDGTLRVLSTSDLAGIEISPPDVVSVVEQACRALAAGHSDNPRKLTVKPDDGHSVAYAMLGRDGVRQVVAVKTSYKHGLREERDRQHYYTTLTLYDDRTGLPVAMMDCGRIGALRTPAVSALLARELAAPGSRTALV